MTPEKYQELAKRTEINYENHSLVNGVTSITQAKLIHAALGLTSDAGEIAACVERFVCYGHDLDTGNLYEELGDCLWYIALACNAMDWKIEDIMAANTEKLEKRYPEKFDSETPGPLADGICDGRIEYAPGAVKPIFADPPKPGSIDDLHARHGNDPDYQKVCKICNHAKVYKLSKKQICPQCHAKVRSVFDIP